MRWGCILVYIHNEHQIMPHKTQENKTGVTAAVTPVSYPFEPVIAVSKQLLYGAHPDGAFFCFYLSFFLCRFMIFSARYMPNSATGTVSSSITSSSGILPITCSIFAA